MAAREKPGLGGSTPRSSKLDGITGSHTRDVLVWVLILVLITALVFGKDLDSVTKEAFKAGMLLLLGFFTGSKVRA